MCLSGVSYYIVVLDSKQWDRVILELLLGQTTPIFICTIVNFWVGSNDMYKMVFFAYDVVT